MQFFYEEQLHRMECMAQEPVLFEDILCQIVDMVSPEVNSQYCICLILSLCGFYLDICIVLYVYEGGVA